MDTGRGLHRCPQTRATRSSTRARRPPTPSPTTRGGRCPYGTRSSAASGHCTNGEWSSGTSTPNNILVRPDSTIAFIDLAASSESGAAARQVLAAPGSQAPAGHSGPEIDRYALGCLRLGIFVPLAQALTWRSVKVEQFIDLVTGLFPVPADFAEQVRRDLGATTRPEDTEAVPVPQPLWPVAGPERRDWPALRASLARGILSAATPGREDRLFPGDIEQFHSQGGGTNLAFGASGVLWALAETGVPVPEEHLAWLTRSVGRSTAPRPGFYDGLSEVAYALDRLGRAEHARELFERALSLSEDDVDHSLFGGHAGIGLTLLHFAAAMARRLSWTVPYASPTRSPARRITRPELGGGRA